MKHELPPLPYDYKALEPYIDARTMEIHHDKHHQTYVTKLNEIVEGTPEIQNKSIEDLLKNISAVPEGARKSLVNMGGGHFNHSFFWTIMKQKQGDAMPEPTATSELGQAIATQFGGYASFKEQFTKTANSVFGSGWTWLVVDASGKLSITSTANQDCPLSLGVTPVMTLDEWEHAYYLSYQNKRPDYVEAFWNVMNWEQAEQNYINRG